MNRTFAEIRKEVDVILAEYEQDLSAYSDWMARWRARQGDFSERTNPITGEVYDPAALKSEAA